MAEAEWEDAYFQKMDDYLDVAFQLAYKCEAHGYGSPEEMLRDNPQMQRDLDRGAKLEREGKRHYDHTFRLRNKGECDWDRHPEHPEALRIARQIVDLAHRAASEGEAKPLLLRDMSRTRRLAVHKMVEHMPPTR